MERQRLYYLKRVRDVVEQSASGEFIPLKDNEVILGRKELRGEHISRTHAKFSRTGDNWTVTNMGRNGVFVNDVCIEDQAHAVCVGDLIQFGQPDTHTYRLKMKEIPGAGGWGKGAGSHQPQAKKSKLSENERYGNLSSAQRELEQRLEESANLQHQLEREKEELQASLQRQQKALEERYEREKEELEQRHTDGALAQQALLNERETLASNLKAQVAELRDRLEVERTGLEERLSKEEEERSRILKEKDSVMALLEEQNAHRAKLEQELKENETLKEELQQQVDEIVSASKAKEVEQLQAEQQLRTKLAAVEREMQERIEAEVKKSTELAQLESKREMEDLVGEKERLEAELQLMKERDDIQRGRLEEELQLLEAQKMSLEQELATSVVSSADAKREVVNTVSDVLENEFQCPICNELFITAIMLNCSHTFCRYCIDQWKKNRRECPNCRQAITSETRSLVVDNFIDKIVPTLSDDMKAKRNDIVNERKAEMEAAALAQAQAQAARRGRGGRGAQNRGRGRLTR